MSTTALGPPDGTRFVAPAAAAVRREALQRLHDLYAAWGYQPVEVPALERFDPTHPRAAQSFKLSDRDGSVLALRADFTPALAQWVRLSHPAVARGKERALRLSYDGLVWHYIDPELARVREFTQVGIELVGVSNARADAEIIHLARESVRAVGLTPRVEVGNPAYVRALFDAAGVPKARREALADAIDRKDRSDTAAQLEAIGVANAAAEAILAASDLYGDQAVLQEARRTATTPEVHAALDRLEGVVAEFEDASDLMLDLGMARRLSYYTGVTFRAYTFDFGQPLLGGGRYDGALLPHAAGFSIGLERLLGAANGAGGFAAEARSGPLVLSLDDPAARKLRAGGVTVLRALATNLQEAEREAGEAGADYLLVDGRLLSLGADEAGRAMLEALLAQGGSGG